MMPFLSLLFTRSSSVSSLSGQRSSPTPVFMDAGGAQHLASALLFGIRPVNALVFFQARRPATPAGPTPQQRRRTLAAAFSNIADVSNPSGTTAAAYVVMFMSLSEAIARSEAVGPGFLPCEDPSHLRCAPASAVCGMLLNRSFHMSTFKLGGLASELQARLWRMIQELTWGYDPAGSSFFTEAVHLVDQPSVHTPGVSFLQLPANRRRVAGWQSHMLATGVLDDAACPVRPAFKPPVADDDDGGGDGGDGGAGAGAGAGAADEGLGGGSVPEVDPTEPLVIRDEAALAMWQERLVRFRSLLWALMHVVGGAAPRITESGALLVCASCARPRRGLFVHNGLTYTILTYSKTFQPGLGGGRPIIRWMDAKTSTLILLLLVFL